MSILLSLVYLVLWYVAYLSPDFTCDGPAHHIPVMSMWANRGFIYWINPNFQHEPLVNGYPKSIELLGFVPIRAAGLSDLANTLNLLYLPFGILGLASLACSLGASRRVSLFTGLLWVLIPVNLFQATTAFFDSAYGSLAVACIALLAAVQQELRGQTRIPWQLVPGVGATAGLALAAKGSAGLLVGGGFAALIAAALVSSIAARRASRGVIWRTLRVALVAGFITLAVGGFWYARNYVMTGTPLYPVGLKLGNKVIFPGQTVSDAIWEAGNTPEFMKTRGNKERIAHTWTQTLIHHQDGVPSWPASIMGVDSRSGGLGFLWLAGCLPALFYALISSIVLARRKPERLSLWFVMVVVTAAFLGSPMNWWACYTVWIYGLGLPAFGLALSDLLAAGH